MNFRDKLSNLIQKNNSLLCIGLDPDMNKIPEHLRSEASPFFAFNKQIIDTTSDLVCCYKPNIAFYEAEGISGLTSLKQTIEYVQKNYPKIPILLDAKRGDIGNTASYYAKSVFEYWDADAVTVWPYIGEDAILPYLSYKEKCTILLIKTSNPDSGMFQNLTIAGSNKPFYLTMAEVIAKWQYANIGLFVGATYPNELHNVRALFANSVILTAGIGAQGAATQKAVKAGIDATGGNLICNNSREIIYAESGTEFAEKAREKALILRDTINSYRI